jgi:orotidine-5'-phosphate decarboxylase
MMLEPTSAFGSLRPRPSFAELLADTETAHQSMLCVGLDPDPARFPMGWADDTRRIFDFCRAIVDATHDLVLAYKPQIAHFAAHRAEDQLEQLIAHIRDVAPEVPVILDAKRGDIGSTAELYAREVFERYRADAVTVSPYLGLDAIEPYLAHDGRGVLLLCRTSNPGAADLQARVLATGEPLYEAVASLAAGPWNASGRLGLVVGATAPSDLARVRSLAPTLPLLVPGVGAQGGDVGAVVAAGWRRAAGQAGQRSTGPLIVNSSRAVLYASAGDDFAQAARAVAVQTRDALRAAARAALVGATA